MVEECRTLQEVMLGNKNLQDKGIVYFNSDKEEVFTSYQNLYEDALTMLGNMQSIGIKEEDLMIFQFCGNREFITTFWACILGRIIPVPLAIGKNEEYFNKLARICKILKKPYIIFDDRAYKQYKQFISARAEMLELNSDNIKVVHYKELTKREIKGRIAECKESDIAFIQFSSGSTGSPKGVIMKHSNLIANTEGIIEGVVNSEDSTLSWMPLTHDMGLIGFHLVPFRRQIIQYLIPTDRFIYSPLTWLQKASEHKATILSSPNFGYTYYLKALARKQEQKLDLSSVRIIFNGAEPISIQVCNEFLERMKEFGLRKNTMFTVYGLAEAGLAVAFPNVDDEVRYLEVDRKKLGIGDCVEIGRNDCSIKCVIEGRPIKYCEVKIINDKNQSLAENMVGYICIRGENVTTGFFNDLIETQKVIDKDGWLNTMDLGFMHQGELVVTGRAKDVLFVNGTNFYSTDLEEILVELDDIERGKVAVCSCYDSNIESEELLVFVCYRKKIEEFVKIANRVREKIWEKLGIKIRHVLPVMAIPKTTSGKIQRYKLIQNYVEHKYDIKIKEIQEYNRKNEDMEITGCLSETQRNLKEIYMDVFKNEEIKLDDNLFDLGGDSLLLTQIQNEIELLYPGKVNVANIYANASIRKLAGFIDGEKMELMPSFLWKKRNINAYLAEERFIYNFTLEEVQELKNYVQQKKCDEESFLLAVYSYVWLEKTSAEHILLYAKLERWKGKIRPIKICNGDYENFEMFMHMVQNNIIQADSEKEISSLESFYKNRQTKKMWLLFLNNFDSLEVLQNIELFDYSICMQIDEKMTMTGRLNSNVIDVKEAEEIFKIYISIINTIIH